MKTLHCNANPGNLDNFVLDCENFAEGVVGEIRFGSDARDKWACPTSRHCLAPEFGADLLETIPEGEGDPYGGAVCGPVGAGSEAGYPQPEAR